MEGKNNSKQFGSKFDWSFCSISRGGSRTAAASKVELFVIIVNGWKRLTIITKSSTFHVVAVLNPPLIYNAKVTK